MLGASLTEPRRGQALSDKLALKPYRGKPAVRNFRGDDGNVGIIEARSAPSSYSTVRPREPVQGVLARSAVCLLPGWNQLKLLDLAPVSWQQTLQRPEVQAKLQANIYRAATRSPDGYDRVSDVSLPRMRQCTPCVI